MHESACMVEKSNSGIIQSGFLHVEIFILEFDSEFPNEFVLARSDLHVERNESRVDRPGTLTTSASQTSYKSAIWPIRTNLFCSAT